MKKKLVKELLTRNPKMFQALHVLYDFDFETDFEIIKICGRFTLNSLKKSLGVPELYDYNVAAIITNIKYNEKYNYIVKAAENGFCIDSPRNVWWSEYRVDHFYGKGSFEAARKEENIVTYVICQKKELAKKASEKRPELSERFDFVSVIRWGDGRGKHGISQIDIKDKQHNGKKFTYKTRRPESSESVNYFLDKSGYLVEEKKSELQQKAKALRTKREKAAADNADFTNESNAFFERMEELKKAVCEKILKSTDYDTLCNAERILSAMRWLQLSIDRFKERNEKKQFSSIASANSSINNINLEFEKIAAMF